MVDKSWEKHIVADAAWNAAYLSRCKQLAFGEEHQLIVADTQPPNHWRPKAYTVVTNVSGYKYYGQTPLYWYNVKRNMLLKKGFGIKWNIVRQNWASKIVLKYYREVMGYA